ncbi:MAG: histidine kinase dimerization/phosphoacceptor domain -containing protein [Propionivibrio sp.]
MTISSDDDRPPTDDSANAGSALAIHGAPAKPAILPLGDDAFRRVVEWAPSAMVLIDGNGTIVLVNAQTEKMFGYERAALIGRSVEILVPERFRHHHRAYRAGYLGDPQPRPMGAGRDLAGRRSDGSEFPIEIGLNPIETEAGTMALASIIDISERLRTQQRLEDALREKTVLLNEVHHRVKNNLQVVTSLLNLQAEHATDPNVRAILGESCGRVKAMSLTHQLLYQRKDFSHLDLAEYLQRLVQSIRASYRVADGHVELSMDLPGDGLHLDLERCIPCGLLINELLTNAFKHAFPAERRGKITVRLVEESDERICLSVGDDGIGLPPDAELAQRSSLGLQLVPLLVEQLHGILVIERNVGTRFAVSFPKELAAKEA